jgi:hypothetical protein
MTDTAAAPAPLNAAPAAGADTAAPAPPVSASASTAAPVATEPTSGAIAPADAADAAASIDSAGTPVGGLWDWLSSMDPALAAGWITGLCTVLAVVIAAGLAYRAARDHNRRAHDTAIHVERLRREIDALERIWRLLAFMSENENEQTILVWREDRQKQKTFFVHLDRLRRFVFGELPAAFYTDHAGLHLPSEIKEQLFAYRGRLIGLHFRYRDTGDDVEPIELKKPEFIAALRNAYHQLNASLRAALDERYRRMQEAQARL